MAIGLSHVKTAAAAFAFVLLGTGCAGVQLSNPPPSGAEWDHTYWAVVKTLPQAGAPPDAAKELDRLKAYQLALMSVAGAANLEDQFIGCVGCARLSNPSAPPSELKYIFYQVHLAANKRAFARAMKQVQSSPLGEPRFILTYNDDPPPGQACPTTCKPKAVCIKFSGCDGNGLTPVCDPCP